MILVKPELLRLRLDFDCTQPRSEIKDFLSHLNATGTGKSEAEKISLLLDNIDGEIFDIQEQEIDEQMDGVWQEG